MTSIQIPSSKPFVLIPKISKLSLNAIMAFCFRCMYLPLTWYFQKKAILAYMSGVHWWIIYQKLKSNPGMMLKATFAISACKALVSLWGLFGTPLHPLEAN